MKTFYLATPIYYPNARPHVGSAYTTIVCDVLARYKRMCGYDVAFLTGTDEHGEKLERAAAAAGQTPSQFVAEKRKLFIQLWEKLGMKVSQYPYPDLEPDSLRFIYTTHPDHEKSVRRMLLLAKNYPLRHCSNCNLYVHRVESEACPNCNGILESKPVIYKKQYQGRYCVSDERYVSDGTDPVDCDVCGRPAELISEENYFFRLSAFQDRLLELYEKHPEFVAPDYRRNEVKSFVKSGLRDISVSRKRLKWGIPWPDDPEQVVYVWYDALTSYLTGIGYAQDENGTEEFRKYWRNRPGVSELVHMIGKDILRFHAVYWPAFIMAAYPDQPEMLPTTVFAHGWIYYEQDKMSKSKGNVVYPEPIVEALDSFGAPGNDALRYYLLREAPFGQDTSFSYEGLIQRYNSDLANDLGNLANRTVNMFNRYFGGEVQRPMVDWETVTALFRATTDQEVTQAKQMIDNVPPGDWDFIKQSRTEEITELSERLRVAFKARLEAYEPDYALANTWGFISEVNKYLVENQPWSLAEAGLETNRKKIETVLCTAAEAVRFATVLLAPIMPHSAERLWIQLGCEGRLEDQRLDELKWGRLKPGTKVTKPEIVFPRLDKAKTLAKLEELAEIDRERGKPAVGALREAPLQTSPQAPRQVPVQLSLTETGGEPDKSKEAFTSVQTEKKPDAALSPDTRSRAPNPQPPVPDPLPPGPQPPFPGPNPQPPIPGPPPPAPEPPAPTMISIGDFAKVEMRVGEVKAAEHVPGASKLLKLMVDIGTEVRQVVAGLAEYYRPENLVGMKVVVVTNLQPRRLRGVESNGMIIAASVGDHGRPVLVTFKEDVENGARLK
ncbi:MAG: methionine--tRNA ligase [Terriglobia bacterium]|jgi:methionyl-tRNA synthetase